MSSRPAIRARRSLHARDNLAVRHRAPGCRPTCWSDAREDRAPRSARGRTANLEDLGRHDRPGATPQAMTAVEFKRLLAQATGMHGKPLPSLRLDHRRSRNRRKCLYRRLLGSEAVGARVRIGAHCDIASFVSINCADSHKHCIGLMNESSGGTSSSRTMSSSVRTPSSRAARVSATTRWWAAGTIVGPGVIPPYSLVAGNPMTVKPGYYRARCRAVHADARCPPRRTPPPGRDPAQPADARRLEEQLAAQRVLASGWLAQGPRGRRLRERDVRLSRLAATATPSRTSSGTAALFLALWALGARARVACPVYACSALTNAIACRRHAGPVDNEHGSAQCRYRRRQRARTPRFRSYRICSASRSTSRPDEGCGSSKIALKPSAPRCGARR